MAKNFVLDTSALLTYIEQEDGFGAIENILQQAKRRRFRIYLSFISFMEVYYIAWQEKGEHTAREIMVMLQSLPVERVDSNARLTLSAGRIKAKHRLSVADAFIAATAIEKEAVLVHKDPELAVMVTYIEVLELPYKQ